jgi:cell division septal protein FtsQ
VRKKIINHHKIKRKWGRGVKKASRVLVTSRNDFKSKKDFDWRPSKSNPFSKSEEGVSWKRRIQVVILIICFIGITGVGIYHPFFHINDFEVLGLQRIDEVEFKQAVCGMVDYNKLFLFPAKNYFLIDVDEVREIIEQRFPAEQVIVKKNFPNILSVQVQEKISTIIYDNGKEFSYLGMEGNVVEKLRKVGEDEWLVKTETVTSTNEQGEEITEEKEIEKKHIIKSTKIIKEMGDYPIIFDKRAKKADLNEQVLFPETISGVVEWFNFINKKTDVPLSYFILENEVGDLQINTKEGWYLFVKINQSLDFQFEKLDYLLKNKVDRNTLNYIDLRYQNRVYWQ